MYEVVIARYQDLSHGHDTQFERQWHDDRRMVHTGVYKELEAAIKTMRQATKDTYIANEPKKPETHVIAYRGIVYDLNDLDPETHKPCIVDAYFYGPDEHTFDKAPQTRGAL